VSETQRKLTAKVFSRYLTRIAKTSSLMTTITMMQMCPVHPTVQIWEKTMMKANWTPKMKEFLT